MKQKELTEQQMNCLNVLKEALETCKKNNIGFVYDNDDCSMSAFNAENVNDFYCGLHGEDDGDELMNWDLVEIVDVKMDFFDSGMQNLYLNFEEK